MPQTPLSTLQLTTNTIANPHRSLVCFPFIQIQSNSRLTTCFSPLPTFPIKSHYPPDSQMINDYKEVSRPKMETIISPSGGHQDHKGNPSSTNSHGTCTFVQADANSFKHVVQMLTGSSRSIPPNKSTAWKKQGFKLYERRKAATIVKNALTINTPQSLRNPPEILSPSVLDFPALTLSPVTPLVNNEVNSCRFSAAPSPSTEEEKAIADKKFYLHSAPTTMTPRDAEPRLLPLFPVTSPASV